MIGFQRWRPSAALRTGVLALGAAATATAGGCQQPAAATVADTTETAASIQVTTAAVEEQPVPVYATFSGSLVADRESVVAAGAAGKVLQTFVDRGDYVQAGALLARLDSRNTTAMLNEANAQLEAAKAQEALASTECGRNEQMFKKGAISRSEYDRVRSNCTTSEWSAHAAEARKTSVTVSLTDSEIRAPFAGFVSERFVNAGEYVMPSSKVATVVSIDPVRAQLTVPEAFAHDVATDMKVQLQAATEPDAKPFEGTVRYISPDIRQASRDLIVEAVVENHDHKLRPGTFVVGRVNLGDKSFAVVPRTALRDDGTAHHLFVVSGGQVEERIVQVGEHVGDLVAITDGVHKGEHIVPAPGPDVRDGAKVR